MAGTKRYNTDIEVRGKQIIYTVPNGTGTLLTYNPTTKELSTRTNSEIISDLNLMTTNTNQSISGTKIYSTTGLDWSNNTLRIYSTSSNPAITFYKEGVNISQVGFDGSGFHFVNSNWTGYFQLKSEGFIKNNSDNSYVLLGGGGHKPASDFITLSQLNNKVDKSGDTMTGGLIIRTPDSIGSNNLGILPQNYKLYLANGASNYGTVFWTETTGEGFIQQQRSDGTAAAYTLYLQRYGGKLMYGSKEVATIDHTHQFLSSPDSLNINVNTLLEDGKLKYNQRITQGSTNMFPMYDNANSIITISSHPGGYGNLLGFNGNQQMFFKSVSGGNYNGWKEFAFTDWVNSNFALSSQLNNYISKSVVFNNNFNDIGGYGVSGIYRANSNNGGVQSLYSPLLHMGAQDTMSQLQIQYGNDPITSGTLFYRGGYENNWGPWRTAWDTVNLNPVTLDTPQTIIHQKTFNMGVSVSDGQKYHLTNFSDPAHYIKRFNDDTDGFGVSTGFAVKYYNDENATLFRVSNQGYIDLFSGGKIQPNGNLILKQDSTGGSATGIYWKKLDNSANIAGIGVLTQNGNFDYAYIGWGDSPWLASNNLRIGPDGIYYKNNIVYHTGNLDINNFFNRFAINYIGAGNDLNNLAQTGFYNVGNGTVNDAISYPNNTGAKTLLHFQNEDIYSALQITTHRYQGNLISRVKSDSLFYPWVRHWGDNDFTQADINNWNSNANNSVKVNIDFTYNTGNNVFISDDYFGGESGLYDARVDRLIAGTDNSGKFRYGCSPGSTQGIVVDPSSGHIAYGGVDIDPTYNHYFNGTIRITGGIYSEDSSGNDVYSGSGRFYQLDREIQQDDVSLRFTPDDIILNGTNNYFDSNRRVIKVTLVDGGYLLMEEIFIYQEITIMNCGNNDCTFVVNNTTINVTIPVKCSATFYVNSIGKMIRVRMDSGYTGILN